MSGLLVRACRTAVSWQEVFRPINAQRPLLPGMLAPTT